MSIRPFRDINRKKTKSVRVGNVVIGDNQPISVQSMTNTLTTNIKATLKQINDIINEGGDLVRVSVPDKERALSIRFSNEVWSNFQFGRAFSFMIKLHSDTIQRP